MVENSKTIIIVNNTINSLEKKIKNEDEKINAILAKIENNKNDLQLVSNLQNEKDIRVQEKEKMVVLVDQLRQYIMDTVFGENKYSTYPKEDVDSTIKDIEKELEEKNKELIAVSVKITKNKENAELTKLFGKEKEILEDEINKLTAMRNKIMGEEKPNADSKESIKEEAKIQNSVSNTNFENKSDDSYSNTVAFTPKSADNVKRNVEQKNDSIVKSSSKTNDFSNQTNVSNIDTQSNDKKKNNNERKNRNVKLNNLKMIYNSALDTYKVEGTVKINGELKRFKFPITIQNKDISSNRIRRKLIKEYGEEYSIFAKKVDIQLYKSLCILGEKYQADFIKDYLNGNANVSIKYDLTNMFSFKDIFAKERKNKKYKGRLSFKNRLTQCVTAYNQMSLSGENSSVKTTICPSKLVPQTLIAGMAILALGIGGNKLVKNINIDDDSKYVVEKTKDSTKETKDKKVTTEEKTTQTQTTEEKATTQEIRKEHITIEEIVDRDRMTTEKVTEESKIIANANESKISKVESKSENTDNVNNNVVTKEDNNNEKEVSKEKETETCGFGIGTKVKLVREVDDEKCSVIKWAQNPDYTGSMGYPHEQDCDYYQISLIVVYDGTDTPIVIRKPGITTNDLYEKYGEDIKISFNVDGYDKDGNLIDVLYGFIDLDEFKNASKKETKEFNGKTYSYSPSTNIYNF